MEYRKIGRAGLQVSEICLGSMTFGGSTDLEEARRIVDLAFDAGINYIDTADGYSRGVSEEMLGKILKGKRRSGATSCSRPSSLTRWAPAPTTRATRACTS